MMVSHVANPFPLLWVPLLDFRRLLGRLLYLTTTRPDIAFATQQLSQFMSVPTESHYKVVLRVLRYLKQSPARGILLSQASGLQISGFSDDD